MIGASNWFDLALNTEKNPMYKWAPLLFPFLGIALFWGHEVFVKQSLPEIEAFFLCVGDNRAVKLSSWIFINSLYILYVNLIFFSISRLIYLKCCPQLIADTGNYAIAVSHVVNNRQTYLAEVRRLVAKPDTNYTWQEAAENFVGLTANLNKPMLQMSVFFRIIGVVGLTVTTCSSILIVLVSWKGAVAVFCAA